jgi:hypothetical protein
VAVWFAVAAAVAGDVLLLLLALSTLSCTGVVLLGLPRLEAAAGAKAAGTEEEGVCLAEANRIVPVPVPVKGES